MARCPTCERAVWGKLLVRLLGFDRFAPRHHEVAFVATNAPGRKGWSTERVLGTLRDVADAAGADAVDQLRRVARQSLRRMWSQGLITPADIDEVVRTTVLQRPSNAPAAALDVERFAMPPTTHAAPARLFGSPNELQRPRTAPPAVLTSKRWEL